MRPGDSASATRRFSPGELAAFAALTGTAPSPEVPEPMIAALFSCLLGMHLPGPGANYLKQSLRFHRSAPAAIPLVARVEVTRLRPALHLVDLATTCHDAAGRLICDGRALVLFRVPTGDPTAAAPDPDS